MNATPITFAGCAGWLHRPEGACHDTAVVLCAPFGPEWLSTYRAYRRLAEALAAAGFVTLRFDYAGTGDSLGDLDGVAAPQAWLESIQHAADEVKRRSGATRVSFFGLRLGGTLAAIAAANRDDVHSLVVWAAYGSGRAFVREVGAFARLQGGAETDALQLAGFMLPPAVSTALRALTLPSALAPGLPALVLERDDLPPAAAVHDALRAAGAAPEACDAPGYAAMMRDAYESAPPADAIAAIVSWLQARHATSSPRSARPTNAPDDAAPLVGHGFTEQALVFGTHARMFGILTLPVSQPRRGPVVVLPNVGSNHHIGPARMTVTLARTLARAGFGVLRFDVAGLGDSAPAPGMPENRLYAEASVRDAQAALAHLDAAVAPEGYALVGLCSGAYLTYHTAVVDPRVQHQVLINLVTFAWDPDETIEAFTQRQFKASSYYLESWRDPQVWSRALRGDVNVRGVATSVIKRALARARTSARQALAGGEAPVPRTFRVLAERGTTSMIVFAAADSGIDEVERAFSRPLRRLDELPGLETRLIDDADHAFTRPAAQAQLLAMLVADLEARFPAPLAVAKTAQPPSVALSDASPAGRD